MTEETVTRHEISYVGVTFKVWQEKGKVFQEGHPSLPYQLGEFGKTKSGQSQAEAFIAGMKQLANMPKKQWNMSPNHRIVSFENEKEIAEFVRENPHIQIISKKYQPELPKWIVVHTK